MSRFFLCLIILCSFLRGEAQHFLYFESQSPFYVKAGDKTFTSGSQGFILVPSLEQKTYVLYIGLSAEGTPKGTYTIEASELDKGYELETSNRGLVLNDMNSKNIIHSPAYDLKVTYETREDPFTMMLARAVNDPSLLRVPINAVQKEEAKEATVTVPKPEKLEKEVTETAGEDTVAVIRTETAVVTEDKKVETKNDQVEKEDVEPVKVNKPVTDTVAVVNNTIPEESLDVYEKSTVRRYSESSTSEGFGLVYIVKTGDFMDTIRLVIPNPKITFNSGAEKPDESLFLPLDKKGIDSLNKACVKAANDDFLSLRKEMASQVSEGLMVKSAVEVFGRRCFSVSQVRSLGVLFLDMEQRFLFYEAAYKNVWDRDAFPSLSSELSGADIQERFQKLISK